MKEKHEFFLTLIFFLLSILFLACLIILGIYYIDDYINLIHNNTLSGIDYLMFNFFYVVGFLPVSVLGLISSILCIKFATSKKIKIILYIESAIFILGIVFSGILYFYKINM